MVNKPLPSSEESEQCVIGSILLDTTLMSQAAETLTVEDFYSPLNRAVFSAMVELFDAQKPIDHIQIGEVLKREGMSHTSLDVVKIAHGLPYVTDLAPYIETVQKKKQLRELAKACNSIGSMAMAEDEEADTVLNHAQGLINEICTRTEKKGFATIGEISLGEYDKTTKLYNREIESTGLKTGLRTLDWVTNGFQPTDLVIIAGRPSMGKSSLLGQIVMNACLLDPAVIIPIFSLEMSKEQYVQRLIGSRAEVDINRMRKGDVTLTELQRIEEATKLFAQMNMHIDDSSTINTLQMRSKLLQLKHRHGRLDAVCIDFLQRMTSTRKSEGRQQEVSAVARDLKGLAKDLGVPVIALSSMSRGAETRTDSRPKMSDLRDSGDIESEADFVGLLYRPHYYNPDADPTLAELIIDKHRNGATMTINLHFLREYTRFSDYD